MAEIHKCADCGYLTIRNRKIYSLDEADIDFREKGIVPTVYDEVGRNPHKLHRDLPLCFVGNSYLSNAIKNIKHNDNPFDEIKEIIQTENDCKEFTEWRQGYTPIEHREMLDRQWMLDYQTRREEADRAWQHKERKNDKTWRVIELICLIIGAGLFTLLGAWITRGA